MIETNFLITYPRPEPTETLSALQTFQTPSDWILSLGQKLKNNMKYKKLVIKLYVNLSILPVFL